MKENALSVIFIFFFLLSFSDDPGWSKYSATHWCLPHTVCSAVTECLIAPLPIKVKRIGRGCSHVTMMRPSQISSQCVWSSLGFFNSVLVRAKQPRPPWKCVAHLCFSPCSCQLFVELGYETWEPGAGPAGLGAPGLGDSLLRSTTSGQDLTTLSMRKIILTSNVNLCWCNMRLLPGILSLITWEKRPTTSLLQPPAGWLYRVMRSRLISFPLDWAALVPSATPPKSY